jgi:hypothetical protein
MSTNPAGGNSLTFSYLALRKAIGILGVALPFILLLGAWLIFKTGLRTSISAYYYTGMRDVLVGTLWAIGFFLLSYKGYDWVDDLAGNLACLFGIGVALFPTTPDLNPTPAQSVIGIFHLAFAGLFFITLAFFSLFLFTKTQRLVNPTPRKLIRNHVYRTCGWIMIACILLMTVYTFLPASAKTSLQDLSPIFWLETFAILSFGISWLVKGEALLADPKR